MSAGRPLRERLQSNSPDPDVVRPTTPLRISKNTSSSPRPGLSPRPQSAHVQQQSQSQVQVQVARRSSSSFKHVSQNNLVTKSPFRVLGRFAVSPSPRKVSGEKRPRPDSMHEQSETENEKPYNRKRRQSNAYIGLFEKEPVTKSPFRRSEDASSSSSDPPPPLPPPKLKPKSALPPSAIPIAVSSPARSALSTPRKLRGPRTAGEPQSQKQSKTVTFDPECHVFEFDSGDEGLEDVSYDNDDDEESGWGYGFNLPETRDDDGTNLDEDAIMNESYDFDEAANDSIIGAVNSLIKENCPGTPPGREDEDDARLLPPSPSPAKHRHSPEPPQEGPSTSASPQPPQDIRYSQTSLIKDEDAPFEDSILSNDSLDPANLSIGNSEVSITNLDTHSLLADVSFEDAMLTGAFHPLAASSPRDRSRSGTPLDRSFEARSTPSLTPSRITSSRSGSNSNSPRHQRLFRPSSTSSFGASTPPSKQSPVGRERSPITREGIRERMQRRSQEALARSREGSPALLTPGPVAGIPEEPEMRAERMLGVVVEAEAHVQHEELVVVEDEDEELEEEEADDLEGDTSRITEPVPPSPPAPTTKTKTTLPLLTRHNPTHDGVLSLDPEPQPIDPPRPTLAERAHSVDITTSAAAAAAAQAQSQSQSPSRMDARRAFAGLELDFEHGFALGEEGMSVSSGLGIGMGGMGARARRGSMHLSEISALDKIVVDWGGKVQGANDTSLVSEGEGEGVSYGSLHVEAVTEGVKAERFELPDIVRDDEEMRIDLEQVGGASAAQGSTSIPAFAEASPGSSPPPPPPPAKDAIRARDEAIKTKRREARMAEQDEEDFDFDSDMGIRSPRRSALSPPAPAARPSRRRSRSTDGVGVSPRPPAGAGHRRAATAHGHEREGEGDLLDVAALGEDEAPLEATIRRELMKREVKQRAKYHVRERTETIYASSDARSSDGADGNTERAWRAIRRPSDMNEYAKQLRELREQQKLGKAHGKVFVKVCRLQGLSVPIPEQPTKVTCTLNNGIHFVTTPEAVLARECDIDQEFELIEHSKLEFTLTIKVRKDPHVVAQYKLQQPPTAARPPPQPLPPPASKGGSSKHGGMRSFLGLGSPKKSKASSAARATSPLPPPAPAPAPTHRPQENLARYLKPDGSLGRSFIAFKDIAAHCDTRLLETTFPLIGQRLEVGSTSKAQQIGEIVLQIFRLPPLPGIPPEQLPQSLEECHRGLTHTRWHKSCYMQGTLTQIGGDCTTWRRRHLRIVGSNLVAYNDVTKRAISSIDLRKAQNVVDIDDNGVRSPASARSGGGYDDDSNPYGVGRVDRSFQIDFGKEQIMFYADTDHEKAEWLAILRALIGRIPPNPLWAEVLFQRQGEAKQGTPGPTSSR